jgi:FAD/FMN-containing dehydrogenase/Fe-S oxidoreductase
MATSDYREIPYNYTSASDEQIVRQLFDDDTWSRLESLREKRITGRSARLLLRFMGDLFMLKRNPYVVEQLVTNARRRREFLELARRDLDVVAKTAHDQPTVELLIRRCRERLERVTRDLVSLVRRRGRTQRALAAVVGDENVLFDPFALVSHATDATDWRLCLPLAVVRPYREEQVAPLLRAIARLGLHAIPRGAGTGLTGGAVPLREDCVMVNLERLDQVRSVRASPIPQDEGGVREALVMDVEAGTVTETAMHEAKQHKHVFATDPTSAWACTIGGNLAENAGGKSAVLWGTAIDNVLAFRMALPNGRTCSVERVNHPLRKILPEDRVRFEVREEGPGAAEPRVIELFGSQIRKKGLWKDITNKALGGIPGLQKEGTDGVITSARFVLHPEYAEKRTACLEFFGDDMDEAARVILRLAEEFPNQGEEALMALEHFDEEYVRAIEYRTKAPRDERPKAVLLIDIVGHDCTQIARASARLERLLEPYPDTCLFFARDEAEGARFWADRKKLGAIAKRTNAFKLNEDIVLPLEALAEFARYVALTNVEEERHSQRDFVSRLRQLIQDAAHHAERKPDAEGWLAAKLERALSLTDSADAALGASDAEALRDLTHVQRLRLDLAELFAGYAEVQESMSKLWDEVRARLIVVATHMHAGDGNVHVNIPVFSNDREMMQRAAATADAMMEKAVHLGGVVSGEHGIGITKFKHLEPALVAELETHRKELDPEGLMNPGKLSDRVAVERVFTPSFNLLELEARILQHDQLFTLAERVSQCVRCGKCKPNCCVFSPTESLFYHPRNKNLAIGSLVEALLYEAQRFRSTEFEFLRYLEEVADHCTLCHKCLDPCPVRIDSGQVSILERQILAARGYKRLALPTRVSLAYLSSKNRTFNAVVRSVVLKLGTRVQRLLSRSLRSISLRRPRPQGPLALLASPVPAPAAKPLHRSLPVFQQGQALLVAPAVEAKKTVFYFPGCGSERLHSDVGKATLLVLLEAGCRVVLPPPFLCCGFPLAANAKDREHSRQVLADTIIFSQIREMLRYLSFDAVVVSCGTCKEALEHMGAHRVFDATLADAAEFALGAGLPQLPQGQYLYHQPCHDSMNGRAVALLGRGGARVEAVPHCCSEAGTLALSRPDVSGKMLNRKTRALCLALERRAEKPPILTNCPSCLQGLGRNAELGAEPRHVSVELARHVAGTAWAEKLAGLVAKAEVVNF